MGDHLEQNAKVSEGIGLAISGGGHRATLFHLGAFWWLCENEILKTIDRISSVSSGSITSAMVGLKWAQIEDIQSYKQHVVNPVRTLTSTTIDSVSIIRGLLFPGTVSKQVSKKLSKYLFGNATLQDLPDNTRFVINATNVETGKLWRFSKPYMGDYLVGLISNPTLSLADAVTASSAFPPVLSPFTLKVETTNFDVPGDRELPGLQDNIKLTDGGVYDNIGLEAIEKRYPTILVSDAAGTVPIDADNLGGWVSQTQRVMRIIHGRVSSHRKRELIQRFERGEKGGTYWGVGTNISDYELQDAFDVDVERIEELSEMPTRMKRVDCALQERMINWGYAVCDAAMRRHVFPDLPKPSLLPYPDREI